MKVKATITGGTLAVSAVFPELLPVSAEVINPIRIAQYADYTGDYTVTSFCADPLLTSSLILPTNDKHMIDDVTVFSVPTSEEDNAAGGVTFTIG